MIVSNGISVSLLDSKTGKSRWAAAIKHKQATEIVEVAHDKDVIIKITIGSDFVWGNTQLLEVLACLSSQDELAAVTINRPQEKHPVSRTIDEFLHWDPSLRQWRMARFDFQNRVIW